jgi:hypothetical protein
MAMMNLFSLLSRDKPKAVLTPSSKKNSPYLLILFLPVLLVTLATGAMNLYLASRYNRMISIALLLSPQSIKN